LCPAQGTNGFVVIYQIDFIQIDIWAKSIELSTDSGFVDQDSTSIEIE